MESRCASHPVVASTVHVSPAAQCHRWTISAFPLVIDDIHLRLANTCTLGDRDREYLAWRVTLRPCSDTDPETGHTYIGVWFYLEDSYKPEVKATCTFIVKGTFDRKKSDTKAYKGGQSSEGYGWSRFMSREDLLTPDNGFLNDNRLTVICKIEILDRCTSPQLPPDCGLVEPPGISTCSLEGDMKKLLTDARHSDVKLWVGEVAFESHKDILSVRSPVFEAMFAHDCQEKAMSEVVVEDMDRRTMEQMLEYIYTGRCADLHGNADRLLCAADRYLLTRLRGLCLRVLVRNLTDENVIPYMLMSEQRQLAELKAQTFDYVRRRASTVTKRDDWAQLTTCPGLMGQLVAFLAEHAATMDVEQGT